MEFKNKIDPLYKRHLWYLFMIGSPSKADNNADQKDEDEEDSEEEEYDPEEVNKTLDDFKHVIQDFKAK